MGIRHKIGERGLYIAKSFSFSLVARILGLLFTIIITPLMLNYLGDEKYAIWSILISFSGFLAFSDFGLSAGLLNFILKNKNNRSLLETGIISTFWFLVLASIVLMILLGIVSSFINWNSVFDVKNLNINSLVPLIILLFLFNIPFSIVQKIQFGFLHNHIYHTWEIIQKTVLIISILIGITLKLNLSILLIFYYSIFILINIANLIIYSKKNDIYKISIPKKIQIDKTVFSTIFKTGLLFLIMNLTYTFGRSSDRLIIGYFGKLQEVTNYDILLKPFEIFMVFVMMFTSTLWSAFGDALIKKDFKWIKSVIKKCVWIVIILVMIITLFMAFNGNYILEIWLGKKYNFQIEYFIGLGLWILILALSNVFSAFLNAANRLVFQIYTFLTYAIISLIFKIFFITNYSLLEFIHINTICYFLTILLPSIYYIKKRNYESV